MAPNPIPRDPQSQAAGAGSAFDTFVKIHIAGDFRDKIIKGLFNEESKEEFRKTTDFKKTLFDLTVEEQNRKLSWPAGQILCKKYVNSNIFKSTQFSDIEITRKIFLDQEVPVFCKIDARVNDSPFDWKVKGFYSATGASPAKGYIKIEDLNTGEVKGPHKTYHPCIKMSEIDSNWAMQLATYGWALGRSHFSPFKAHIHALIIRPSSLRLASYTAWIDVDLQAKLWFAYKKAWRDIYDGTFVNSLAQDRFVVESLVRNEKWY